MPGDQTDGVVGKGAYSHVNRLFDRERMALATSKTFREKASPVQRSEEVDALLHAGRHPNLVRALAYHEHAGMVQCIYFEFWDQSLADRRYCVTTSDNRWGRHAMSTVLARPLAWS